METAGFEKKVKLLEEMNAYARGKDGRVRQVSASLSEEWQRIEIIRAGGEQYSDIRPSSVLNVSVVVEDNGRQNRRQPGVAAAAGYETYLDPTYSAGRRWTKRCARRWSISLPFPPPPAR